MSQPKPENAFLNLIFNILIPVLILNKGTPKIGALMALIVALLFPLGYGAYDLYKRRKWNALSILGFTNTLVTGSLAVLGLGGIWFSVKEAFFPFLIGIFVWISSTRGTPVIRTFLLTPHTFNVDTIETRLKENQKENEFKNLLKVSTRLLACSFFLSAALNFILAERIFLPLDPGLTDQTRAETLNLQIAEMTTWSMGVIVVPSVIFMMGILFYVLKGIRQMTGLENEQIMKS